MPERKTKERAQKLQREGKAPSTQAGPFVHEEIEHIREGKHGAKNTKQAIAIGLSKARRAGVKLPAKRGSSETAEAPRKRSTPKRQAKRSTKKASTKKASTKARRPSAKRSNATTKALKRAPRTTASPRALSRQARKAARRRKRTSTPRTRTKRASA